MLRRLPDRDKSALRCQTMEWPLVIRRIWDDVPKGVHLRRPPPSAAAIERMHECLGWMLRLAKAERNFARAVWLICAECRAVGQVAKTLGVDRRTARVWRDNGLARIDAMRATKKCA
ncbi:MAG TPA: DUF6362 family protein [Rhizomicrobium sp.]|nr:DUF6362 family protein [Rhizomicrobium sp.]